MRRRRLITVAISLAFGLAIAWLDSSPGWDSTGISAGLLILATGAVAAVAGERPWAWVLLVGLPTPLVEIAAGGPTGSILALGFAAIGGAAGWAIGRARRRSAQGSLRE